MKLGARRIDSAHRIGAEVKSHHIADLASCGGEAI